MSEQVAVGEWTDADRKRDRDIRLGYYLCSIQVSWSMLTPRERKRLQRIDPVIAHAIRRIVAEGLTQ